MKAMKMSKKGAIIKDTDNILRWFPELKKLLEHFEIEHMTIRMKGSDDKFMIYED